MTVPVGGGSCTPEPPASISVAPTNSSDGRFTVSWAASPSACANSYQLEESYNQGTWQSVPLSDAQNQRSWSPSPPKTASGTYAYHVRACNGTNNCSADRVGAQVTVSLPVGALDAPANLKACRGTNGSICVPAGSTLELISGATGASYQIRWDTVDNATSYQYQLETKDHCASNWQNHGWQNVNVAYVGGSGNPANSQCGLDYRYVVKACAGTNCGLHTTTAVMVWIQKQPLRPVATEVTYYHTDALGSPVAQTDASGAVVKSTAYRPWGAPADGSYEQGPGYTGHVTDARTGLSYMQQRYYDPIAGRFLSVDPVAASPESFNRYWYANNNPYKYIDPDGRKEKEKDHRSIEDMHPSARGGIKSFQMGPQRTGSTGKKAAPDYDSYNFNVTNFTKISTALDVVKNTCPLNYSCDVPNAFDMKKFGKGDDRSAYTNTFTGNITFNTMLLDFSEHDAARSLLDSAYHETMHRGSGLWLRITDATGESVGYTTDHHQLIYDRAADLSTKYIDVYYDRLKAAESGGGGR